MEEGFYSGTVCKINSLRTDYQVILQENEFGQLVITMSMVSSNDMNNLRENDDANALEIKIGNDGYLSVFDAYIKQESTKLIQNGMMLDSKSEIVLVSSSVIKGNTYFDRNDKLQMIRFEITDGHEMLGLSPYDLNFAYGDIQNYQKIDIPMKIKCISINTIIGEIDFVVLPKYWFRRDSLSIGFSHYICLRLIKQIGINQLREVLNRITDFFSIMCGEQVTINKLEVAKEGLEFDSYEYKGYCNFPRWHLNRFSNSGFDTNNFKRIALFKLRDYQQVEIALDYWFKYYYDLHNAQQAYSRILLDEDMRIVTINKYLAAMQLVEGYYQAYIDEKQAYKEFKNKKQEIIEKLADQEDKDYVKTGLVMPGITFKTACIKFYWKAVRIFKEMDEDEFKELYEESFIVKVVKDRNLYTHSSKRSKPKMHFDELMNIAFLTKEFYRCLLLESMGVDKEIINMRFYHNRTFRAKLFQVFQIECNSEMSIFGFDKDMWHFQ